MKKEIIIDRKKWNFIFGLVPVFYRPDVFEFHFGFFKIILQPSEGEIITRKNYKGFWVHWIFRGFGFSKHL